MQYKYCNNNQVIAGVITSLARCYKLLRGAFGNIASSLQDAGEMIANFPKYLASLPGKIGQFITTSLQKIHNSLKDENICNESGHDFLNGIINNIKTLPVSYGILLETIQKFYNLIQKVKYKQWKLEWTL